MRLIKFINTKIIAAASIVFTLFVSTAAFAQTAAAGATATVKPVDMEPVYRSITYYTLLFLLFCLFIGIIGKALRVYDLTKEVQGKPAINWDVVNGVLFLIFLIVGTYGVYWEYTVHGQMLLPDAASEHGKRIDDMFNLTLIITTIVFILTHIALFGFAYLYKHTGKRKAYFYPHNNTLEKIWTIIPAIVLTVLVLMGFLTWRSIFYKIEDPNNKPINIEVTSSQFQWDIRYPGSDGVVGVKNYKLINPKNTIGIDFKDKNSLDDQNAADSIVIPVGKPVRFILTSKDVIHSFYLPHFRVQLNTVPGMTSYFEFTPTFTTAEMVAKTNDPKFSFILLCAKICGDGHWNMKRTVAVVTQKEYDAWVKRLPAYLNNELRKEFNLPLMAEPVKATTDTASATAAAPQALTALKK
ncbi:MAG: cytochrome c oxidase subunit II [Pedobacter sp.]|nr:MAG: cytochrome c oxidase subunit II [Pedobacter sp.]